MKQNGAKVNFCIRMTKVTAVELNDLTEELKKVSKLRLTKGDVIGLLVKDASTKTCKEILKGLKMF